MVIQKTLDWIRRFAMRWQFRAAGTFPPAFWKALLVVQNDWSHKAYQRSQYDYPPICRSPKEEAHRVLDCWLNIAISEEWVEPDLVERVLAQLQWYRERPMD